MIDELIAGPEDNVALIEADEDRKVTYGELRADVAQLAGRIAALEIRENDRVALVIPEGPLYLRLLLAVMSIGASAAPLNPAYTGEEFRFYLKDLRPRLVLGTKSGTIIAKATTGIGLRYVDVGSREFLAIRPCSYQSASDEDVALVLHTSGTTSRPKQVPLLQRNLFASATGICSFYELSPDDVSFCAMPLFHVHGLVASVLAALAGHGTVVVPTRFVPGRFLRHARNYGVTWLSAGPTSHAMILNKNSKGRIASLRFVRSCSSPLPLELFERCEHTYGVPMLEAYGMTEASHQIASNELSPGQRKIGTVGRPSVGVEIRIVDGLNLDSDSGEVVIRSKGLTPGYVANPEANHASFFDDGWFRTGDRGRIDEDGLLALEGRIKELIIRGGENISPFEVEAALMTHPSVVDAVAFAIPDDHYGEVVGAAVVLNAEEGDGVLKTWCAGRLIRFKRPERIFIVDEIPRTPTGKVQRARIGQRLLGIES